MLGVAGSGLALAGAALYNAARSRQAERHNPPAGAFVEIDGVRLHYLERGSGPPLVLLHGNGATSDDFLVSGLMDLAAKRYRVIAFDRPGFGYSERPRSTLWTPTRQGALITGALAKLGIDKPVVLGHSFGTLVALAMALDYPETVSALVLLSGYYFPTARADVLMFSPPAIPLAGDLVRYTVSPLAGRALAPAMFKAMFSPMAVPDTIAEWPLGLALRPSQIRAAAADAAFMVPAAAAFETRYGELSLPVALVAGDGDKIAAFETHSAAMHLAVVQSELVTVHGAGHMVHYAAPDRVLGAIDRARDRGHAPVAAGATGENLAPPAYASAS